MEREKSYGEVVRQQIFDEIEEWWEEYGAEFMTLCQIFDETCTMDQLGFIHDKESGRIIAGCKLDWYRQMLEKQHRTK